MRSGKAIIAWVCIASMAAEREAAAYPAPRCSTGRWLPNPEVPTTLEGLPAGQPCYSMRVAVLEPVRASNEQCPWTAFEVELALRVRAESVVERAEVTSVRVEEAATPYGYAPCGQSEAERPCRSSDSLCCPDPPLGRSFRIAASVQPFVGGHIYYLASYEVRSPLLADFVAVPFVRPFTGEYVHLTPGAHGPVIPEEECARVTIINLMDDREVVSDWACAGPSDYLPAGDDGFCDPDWCAQLSSADTVAEPVEPGGGERPGGCSAGGVALWGVFAVGLWIRRLGARMRVS